MSVKQKELSNEHSRITKGEGSLGKIYDRLRRASLRRATTNETIFDDWYEQWVAGPPNEFPEDPESLDEYFYEHHQVYVQGVRDALKAVQNRPIATGFLP